MFNLQPMRQASPLHTLYISFPIEPTNMNQQKLAICTPVPQPPHPSFGVVLAFNYDLIMIFVLIEPFMLDEIFKVIESND